jgi:peptidoglycan/LPS O-acetylase OafA/YrhL
MARFAEDERVRTLLLRAASVCVLLLLILVTGATTRSLHVRPDFYAAIAQILPVFLLAIAIEGRLFVERPAHTALRRSITQLLLVVSLEAEACALIAVARGHDSSWIRTAVFLGLAVVVLLFGGFAVVGPARGERNER